MAGSGYNEETHTGEHVPPSALLCNDRPGRCRLEVNGLTVRYVGGTEPVEALGPLDLMVDAGEICAVIGPSGCGKSTLLHVLAGALRGDAGQALLGGVPVDPVAQAIGLVPQSFGLLPWKTVRQNCLLPARIRRQPLGEASERLGEIAARLSIDNLMDRYPGELSGGQRQRAAVARAFAMAPALLLLDEPFSALDELTREEAQRLFRELWRQRPTTTVFVTHSIEEAVFVAGRIVVLTRGPGQVACSIANPLFALDDPRQAGEYAALCARVRRQAGEVWGA